MFIKTLDYISPFITLYYKGQLRHTSILAGLFSIICILLTIGSGIYYGLDFINHKNPSAFYYNRYINDVGIFPINSSSMFSLIQLIGKDNFPKKIDYDAITIIGINITINYYMENNGLERYFHWIYGDCNNDSDTEGIKHLITEDIFTYSVCIRKFYNKEEKKYYNTDEPGFEWPEVKHGVNHNNSRTYGIIIEKCRDEPLKNLRDGTKCKNESAIRDFMSGSYFTYSILDHYNDVLNFYKPITSHFYKISNSFSSERFTINNINFFPMIVKSHNGIWFDSVEEYYSYGYEQNEKATEEKNNSGIYVSFYYWMQNSLHYYERNYKRLPDVLSNMGGMFNMVIKIAEIIYFIISDYIILTDTKKIIFKLDSQIINKKKKIKLDIINKKNNSDSKTESLSKKNFRALEEYNENKNNKNLLNDIKKKETETNLDINNKIHDYSRNKKRNEIIEDFKKIKRKKIEIDNNFDNSEISKDKIINKNDSPKVQIKKDKNIKSKDLNKEGISFCSYLCFFITCYKIKSKFKFYQNCRFSVLSEENIFEIYLNLYKLKKYIKNKKNHKN